ncbi:MAG: class I SAM-dependent methyltransferase [Rhodospirillaceae bacterium]
MHCGVDSLPAGSFDIVFSLGLLDWLTDAQLEQLFAKSADGDFFHAIAERRTNVIQLLHRFYVHVAYGHKTGGYKTRYYDVATFRGLAERHGNKPVRVLRDPRLSFGAIISTLPIPETDA